MSGHNGPSMEDWIAVGVGLHESRKRQQEDKMRRELDRIEREAQDLQDYGDKRAEAIGTLVGWIIAIVLLILAYIFLAS